MQTLTPQEYFTNPYWTNHVLLDVRSPGEHTVGKLPAAKSLPLFTDEERAVVGTLYKQTSPDAALLSGLEIAGGKMRWLVEEARRLAPGNKVVVHCWRGGQRSGSVAWLLERAGFEVAQLTGGYKAARHHIRKYLAQNNHQLRVLSGPTGSGKTPVLLAMQQQGAFVVDLEGLANHKGSAFGALGEAPQPSSEEFENQLYAALKAIPPGEVVWMEDESRMIGHVYMPDEFYERLCAAPVYSLDQPLEWRVNHLVKSYARYPKEDLMDSFSRIRKKLGGQHLKAAIEYLEENDFAAAARIALVYYDKAYHHYGERRQARVVATVQAVSKDPAEVARQLMELG
ncbi:tRNA 2-selenouridine(34) synthase MnmH [Neolewinella aurantiaca]|uniref:tRNA 2-selenouridine(34) synthase MnmH n=1 Tax=Neolewinella aurantiaca TaxID=2602767 RepID=A0A5C7FBV5_9BACT|nr:tRNA 2-selenouridine(34) synthase MnmH [Neolewinella aurantiaca]TXF88383.1 tRNA 2-selenouridine(34) synthase MnmH [Neolewinella aurantiaca]